LKDDLADKIKDRLKKDHAEDFKPPELSTYVQNILWEIIESDELIKRIGPYLEKLAIYEDTILIRDNRRKVDRTIEVKLKDNELYCTYDESFECVHIGFAWALPEVYKALNLKGMKMPNIKDS
jgi:hypothetical protein